MKSTPMKRIPALRLAALVIGLVLTISAFTATYAARAPKTGRPKTVTSSASVTPAVPQVTMESKGSAQSTGSTMATSTPSSSNSSTSSNITAPTPSPAGTSSPAAALPGKAVIEGFPALEQAYSLSCEYASASAVTLFWGNQVSENVFVRQVPTSRNPHLGFRGDINAAFGGTGNYGVYAEALVSVLEANGYNATVFYGGVSQLKANLAAGNPVVVWITAGKDIERTPVVSSYDGQSFTLVAGEHAVVIYGYDNGGVYIMDVASGSYAYTAWDSFVTRWSYFDQMSLVITPR